MKLRFKLDENADPRWREPLVEAGHDVSTAAEQSLEGVGDQEIAERCRVERRCLVTMDLGFAQILDYPPHDYAGLVVLRHPSPTLAGMRDLMRLLAVAAERESPVGKLWILEPGRLRIHQDTPD